MSPRTGRPTDDPKACRVSYRLSKDDVDKIAECSKVLGIGATDVIRKGIQLVYAEAKKKK